MSGYCGILQLFTEKAQSETDTDKQGMLQGILVRRGAGGSQVYEGLATQERVREALEGVRGDSAGVADSDQVIVPQCSMCTSSLHLCVSRWPVC